MRFSWQNLNDRGGKAGPAWRHGRAWLWFVSRRAHFEWSHQFRPYFGVAVTERDEDRELTVSVHLLLLHWYLGLTGVPFVASETGAFGRVTGLQLIGDRLALSWRCDSSEWSSTTGPKSGWEWSVCLLDVLLGRRVYREGVGEGRPLRVVMPEGVYVGTCTIRADSWKRSRWFRRVIHLAHIDMLEGQHVPVPGKGENAWDCGEDGIYGMTCAARTLEEAAAAVRASAMRDRRKYGGGEHWRPSTNAD